MSYRDRQEERRAYENEVFYDVWRSGGDPDRIDYDRVHDGYWDGMSADEAAGVELRAQKPEPQPYPEEELQEEENEPA